MPRYGIFILLVGLLTWMCVRLDWMEGYLPSIHESFLYILEFTCPVLAATVAWDISGFDI